MLDLVQLGDLGERRIDQLSGGQKQRVALARAIVFEPRILLMDEPLSVLDKKLREQMQIEIRHLHERLAMTTIYVTHDQREALTMSDRVAVINFGRFVQIDEPRQLYEHPETTFIADFIGESTFLEVTVRDGAAYLGERRLEITQPLQDRDRRQFLVVRPEKLNILADDSEPQGNFLEGTVEELVYQGESFLLYVTLPGDVTIAVRKATQREILALVPDTGQPIRLGINAEDTIVVPEDVSA